LELCTEGEVAGMVLVDGSTVRQSEFFKLPDENVVAMAGTIRTAVMTGLKGETVLSQEEWVERGKLVGRGTEATKKEVGSFGEVCEMLRRKKQLERRVLGDRSLSVIRANSQRL